ncbi:hypothetical protein C8A01DRAFT_40173 [Parachaetomium inaequale]|uniref:Uncharacterized protein n=1 Tax=Parachaetomium inaequale TaxID=2588326 RepID=A0AAN6SN28_9PEZI|nr:hypothetical protein C8A01DRAFT_40173 [Parachaetomium inaequale]
MHPQLLSALFALVVLALIFAAVDPLGVAPVAASVLAASLSAAAAALAPPAPSPPTAAAASLVDTNPVPLAISTPAPEPLARGNLHNDGAGTSKWSNQWHQIHGPLDDALYYALGLLMLYLQAAGYYDDGGWDEDCWDDEEEDEEEAVEGGGWQGGWEGDEGHVVGVNDLFLILATLIKIAGRICIASAG